MSKGDSMEPLPENNCTCSIENMSPQAVDISEEGIIRVCDTCSGLISEQRNYQYNIANQHSGFDEYTDED